MLMTEQIKKTTFENRYQEVDKANAHSWYMTEADRPFTVNMSVHSAGHVRQRVDKNTHTPEDIDFINQQNKAARFILAGNMSTVQQPDGKVPYGPSELSDEGRLKDASGNMQKYFETEGIDIDPATVRVLNPERDYSTPLTVVNVDEDPGVYTGNGPIRLEKSGDFIYTYNPDIVLAVRPADCPIAVMTAETPKGRVDIMTHFAWRGPASGQFDDLAKELDALDVERETMRVYITPGGQAETYQFTNYVADGKNNPEPVEGALFVDVKKEVGEDGTAKYSFGIDTPNAVYEAFLGLGLDKKQIFLDTSDTTSLASGYGSHGRAMRQKEDNVRDLVTAKFHR